jgi:hypothetical protein
MHCGNIHTPHLRLRNLLGAHSVRPGHVALHASGCRNRGRDDLALTQLPRVTGADNLICH